MLGLHFAILHYASARSSTLPSQPTNLTVNYRSGQSFITWTERADLVSETYRIYRYSQAITAANLMSAGLLYDVPEGTARFFENRFWTGSVWKNRYLDRYVIQDHGPQLITGTGLLIWTFSPQDFNGGNSGNAYYAVTTVYSGTENTIDFNSANSIGPIGEVITDPLPVEISNTVGAGWHVFIQYMDLRNWNPTFHAPNGTNSYYGLNSADPEVARALQYAYDYAIFQPGATQCGSMLPAQLPASVWLHPWQGNNYPPASGSSTWCAYQISPIDETETWWFGFARDHDFRKGGSISHTDRIVNYTEQRVLRMIYDLERSPIGPPVDPNRVYVSGYSMGAGGTLGFALRYPNVFAAAYATKPATNYQLAGGWVGNISAKWGSTAMSVPVLINAPNHWADGLQSHTGESVWDWENHQSNLMNRQTD
ncbi:MAG TPA: hypothetical protein VFF70_00925, partial [Anaerolineae bacterium]|nr:hypothetical protein [Anaerolineae bacterium]